MPFGRSKSMQNRALLVIFDLRSDFNRVDLEFPIRFPFDNLEDQVLPLPEGPRFGGWYYIRERPCEVMFARNARAVQFILLSDWHLNTSNASIIEKSTYFPAALLSTVSSVIGMRVFGLFGQIDFCPIRQRLLLRVFG